MCFILFELSLIKAFVVTISNIDLKASNRPWKDMYLLCKRKVSFLNALVAGS